MVGGGQGARARRRRERAVGVARGPGPPVLLEARSPGLRKRAASGFAARDPRTRLLRRHGGRRRFGRGVDGRCREVGDRGGTVESRGVRRGRPPAGRDASAPCPDGPHDGNLAQPRLPAHVRRASAVRGVPGRRDVEPPCGPCGARRRARGGVPPTLVGRSPRLDGAGDPAADVLSPGSPSGQHV